MAAGSDIQASPFIALEACLSSGILSSIMSIIATIYF